MMMVLVWVASAWAPMAMAWKAAEMSCWLVCACRIESLRLSNFLLIVAS